MESKEQRIHLSAPSLTDEDVQSVSAAMRSGWLAPAGPDLTAFEQEMASFVGVGHAVGLQSGTAALHLGLKYLGVKPGDAVLVPTVTFGATAFAVVYLGAEPVFVDVDESWNIDPEVAVTAVRALRESGRAVSAVVPVDLYGSPVNFDLLMSAMNEADVPILEDAAEGLGGSNGAAKLGTFGTAAVLSFNGNKIITASGGGMLLTDNFDFAEKVRFWATQSRVALPWYEHEEIGYNYRLSNILAALGRSQLRRVETEVAKRRQIREWYRERLELVEGVKVQGDPPWGQSNAWLTVVRFSPSLYPDAPTRVREFLEADNVESRPVWKPMHRQPVFLANRSFLTGAADALFRDGLCLPSGTALDEDDVDRLSARVIQALRSYR